MKRQNLNYIAVEMLERCGNSEPNERQIRIMERLLSNTAMMQYIRFHYELSKREIHCLFLAAKGYTIQETADFLKVDSYTIDIHRKQLLSKFDCSNMTHTVFEGIRYGVLPPRLNNLRES